jgi:hypothetical protein
LIYWSLAAAVVVDWEMETSAAAVVVVVVIFMLLPDISPQVPTQSPLVVQEQRMEG